MRVSFSRKIVVPKKSLLLRKRAGLHFKIDSKEIKNWILLAFLNSSPSKITNEDFRQSCIQKFNTGVQVRIGILWVVE